MFYFRYNQSIIFLRIIKVPVLMSIWMYDTIVNSDQAAIVIGKSILKGGWLSMEKYEAPEMEIIEFGSEVVIATSVCPGEPLLEETESIGICIDND